MSKNAGKALWPADKVERRLVEKLVPYARNARTHSEAQVAQIARSIEEFGFTVPVLIDPKGNVIAGHGRILAAKMLGLADIPVMVARGWSEQKRRAYVILDNKLALNAGWDDEVLRAEFSDLEGLGFDLSLTGFEPTELAGLRDVRAEGLTDPEQTPEPPAAPVSRLGDIWTLGRHRIVCGDSTDADTVSACLDGAKPHLMVTDPPYGVEYDPSWRSRAGVNLNRKKLGVVSNDDRVDWRDAWALFPGDVIYCWHAGRHASSVQASLEAADFGIVGQIIWAKDRMVLSRGDYHWQHEPCWYAVRAGKKHQWVGGRAQTTLWNIKAREDSGHGHGTQKPVECMRRPIENNSKPGDAVYEPFSGSGTTIIAAEMTGRRCLAIELTPAYVDVAIKRWQDFTGEKARYADGRAFDDVAAERLKEAA